MLSETATCISIGPVKPNWRSNRRDWCINPGIRSQIDVVRGSTGWPALILRAGLLWPVDPPGSHEADPSGWRDDVRPGLTSAVEHVLQESGPQYPVQEWYRPTGVGPPAPAGIRVRVICWVENRHVQSPDINECLTFHTICPPERPACANMPGKSRMDRGLRPIKPDLGDNVRGEGRIPPGQMVLLQTSCPVSVCVSVHSPVLQSIGDAR